MSLTPKQQLFLACKNGNKDNIEDLLNKKGTDVNDEDDERNTCLIYTAFNGWFLAAKILIKRGAIVDTQNDKGETALHIASEKCHINYIKYILGEAKAKVGIRDKKGDTVLHKAAGAKEEQFQETIRILIKYFKEQKVEIDILNDENLTPLHMASSIGKIDTIRMLIQNNADISAKDQRDQNVLHKAANHPEALKELIKIMKEKGKDLINEQDTQEETALHASVLAGNNQSIEVLISNRADVFLCNNKERTVLHMAAEKGFIEIVKKLAKDFDDLLVETDEKGETALHLATLSKREEVVKFLCSEAESKAKFLDKINKKQRSPLLIAIKFEYIEIFK